MSDKIKDRRGYVMILLRQGMTTQGIADKLGAGLRTIQRDKAAIDADPDTYQAYVDAQVEVDEPIAVGDWMQGKVLVERKMIDIVPPKAVGPRPRIDCSFGCGEPITAVDHASYPDGRRMHNRCAAIYHEPKAEPPRRKARPRRKASDYKMRRHAMGKCVDCGMADARTLLGRYQCCGCKKKRAEWRRRRKEALALVTA